jgi:hypothetical protein
MRTISLLIVLASAANARADITTGLARWWKLDDGAGTTAADSSGSGGTLNLSNAPTWVVGQVNGGLQFNGTDESASTAASVDLSGTDDITIAFWQNLDATSAGDPIAIEATADFSAVQTAFIINSKSTGQSDSLHTAINNQSGRNDEIITRPTDDVWVHIAVTIDKGAAATDEITFYKNGAVESSTQPVAVNSTNSFGNHTIYIGARNNASLWFKGELDEIRVYSRALSAADVEELYEYDDSSAAANQVIIVH